MPDEAIVSPIPQNPSPEDVTLPLGKPSPAGTNVAHLPKSIGRYRIIRLLGEGGMGSVYEAEQDQTRRSVALKVIKAAWASPEILRRFEQESQALGRLQHPGIAQIYEADSADTGFGVQPYFAMELIHGDPLVEYANEHKLNTRQRLELMIQVCDAVHHAHQRGIIHRDLKPGNILVDETGQPKILDFGLAKVTDSDAQATRQTDMGQILGTLAYMSPEQITADPLALDTRSDVYALGVILYELLAGKMPYTLSRYIHEVVRTIQSVDPAPLSTVNRTYRGDIETIVAKALEKDKNRRYGSAAGLAADLRRYLNDEPIIARPASASYQLQKFARRHKALVAGAAAVFVVLILGVIASTWEAVQARHAEKKAQQQSAVAQAVNDFLQHDLLAQASAYNQSKPDPNITVRTVLDRAAKNIQGKFKDQPEVDVAVRETIGDAYTDLGLYPEARKQLEPALELSRRTLGAESPKTVDVLARLGSVAGLQQKYPEAEKMLTQAVDVDRRAAGVESRQTLWAMDRLGWVDSLEGKYAPAETLLNQVVETDQRVLGAEDRDTLTAMSGLAIVYMYEGKYARAAELDEQLNAIDLRLFGPENPRLLINMTNLAIVYNDEGKYAQAEALEKRALDGERRVLGADNRATLISIQVLAGSFMNEGKYAEAEALYKQALEPARRVMGPEAPQTLQVMDDLAGDYENQGKYAQAEPLMKETVEIHRRVLGPEHPDTLLDISNLASLYAEEGKYAQAEPLFKQALEADRRVLGPEDRVTLYVLSSLGMMYQREGKYALAESSIAQALAGQRHSLGAQHPFTMSSETDLALTYISENKFTQAETLARDALESEKKTQPKDWSRYNAESVLGKSLVGEKKYADAEPLLIEGYQGMLARKDRINIPDLYHLRLAKQWLVQLYSDWNKPDKAAEWKKK